MSTYKRYGIQNPKLSKSIMVQNLNQYRDVAYKKFYPIKNKKFEIKKLVSLHHSKIPKQKHNVLYKVNFLFLFFFTNISPTFGVFIKINNNIIAKMIMREKHFSIDKSLKSIMAILSTFPKDGLSDTPKRSCSTQSYKSSKRHLSLKRRNTLSTVDCDTKEPSKNQISGTIKKQKISNTFYKQKQSIKEGRSNKNLKKKKKQVPYLFNEEQKGIISMPTEPTMDYSPVKHKKLQPHIQQQLVKKNEYLQAQNKQLKQIIKRHKERIEQLEQLLTNL